jgi:hypothetical protein
MAVRSVKEDDPVEDFARREITLDGVAKRVYVAGSGPGVIVMTEMPGISPHDAGFTVYRALARLAHLECGGPGVGAIGMCFTGNFALTMMLEPSLLAPVLSQPAPMSHHSSRATWRAPQCRDRPPDRRSRPADHRRPRRDPVLLHPPPCSASVEPQLGECRVCAPNVSVPSFTP